MGGACVRLRPVLCLLTLMSGVLLLTGLLGAPISALASEVAVAGMAGPQLRFELNGIAVDVPEGVSITEVAEVGGDGDAYCITWEDGSAALYVLEFDVGSMGIDRSNGDLAALVNVELQSQVYPIGQNVAHVFGGEYLGEIHYETSLGAFNLFYQMGFAPELVLGSAKDAFGIAFLPMSDGLTAMLLFSVRPDQFAAALPVIDRLCASVEAVDSAVKRQLGDALSVFLDTRG